MSFVRAVIDWTDGIAAEGIRARGLLFFPMVPWMLVAIHRSVLTIAVAASFSLDALVFVTWRLLVVLKAEGADNDRQYDREGKFKLASEYHSTESATAAAERKRKG